MSIPINNIWFLLSYAWNVNDKFWINETSALKSEKNITKKPLNSLTNRLIKYANTLLRSGLNRGYKEIIQEISGVKGRINISETIKKNGFANLKLTCNFDELNSSVLHNQIIKTTLNNLAKTSELDKNLKEEVHVLNRKLSEIEPVILSQNIFSKIRIHSNIKKYRVPIKICELLYKSLKPNKETGRYNFDKINEDWLSVIFEKFIKNFYIEHLKNVKVHSPKMKWFNVKPWLENTNDGKLLPELRTDIVIDNKESNYKLIIDAKFYPNVLAKPQVFGAEKSNKDLKDQNNEGNLKFKRDHIFQLFAYLKNFDLEENQNKNEKNKVEVSGMLLYPLNGTPASYAFKLHDYKFRIQTIDLNQDDGEIYKQMIEQVKTFDRAIKSS